MEGEKKEEVQRRRLRHRQLAISFVAIISNLNVTEISVDRICLVNGGIVGTA